MIYNNPYYGSTQVSVDRIDNQIKELESLRAQVQRNSQPAINQTFQLAPTGGGLRYVSGVDDVNKELVFTDSVFFNNDMTNMWIKDTKGQVKPYDIKEIIEKDEKDLIIEELKSRLDKLERGESDDKSDSTELDKPITGSV